MTAIQDLMWLKARMRQSTETREMVMVASARVGANGVVDLAESHPDDFAVLVEAVRDLDEQMENLESVIVDKGLTNETRPT